jgi:hypothetical protein
MASKLTKKQLEKQIEEEQIEIASRARSFRKEGIDIMDKMIKNIAFGNSKQNTYSHWLNIESDTSLKAYKQAFEDELLHNDFLLYNGSVFRSSREPSGDWYTTYIYYICPASEMIKRCKEEIMLRVDSIVKLCKQ